jgi:hypothetical protein
VSYGTTCDVIKNNVEKSDNQEEKSIIRKLKYFIWIISYISKALSIFAWFIITIVLFY